MEYWRAEELLDCSLWYQGQERWISGCGSVTDWGGRTYWGLQGGAPLMGCGRGPQYPVEGPSLVCCFLCPPQDAGLVALRPLGQWQGYHNPIFLLPCWGWIQPWNGCVGSMKKPCSAIAVISGALWLTQDFCLLCSLLASDSYCLLGTVGGRESWSQAGGSWAWRFGLSLQPARPGCWGAFSACSFLCLEILPFFKEQILCFSCIVAWGPITLDCTPTALSVLAGAHGAPRAHCRRVAVGVVGSGWCSGFR